jgi:uncharacterized protein involved in outer membrane biogenesis
METIGPKVTQTSLTVSSVHVGILTGSAGVNDLVLGNPEGYKSPNAISVGKTAVRVAPFSALSDKIIIKSVEVRSPEITFEGNPFGANNLKKIMDNVNAFTGGTTAKPADTNAPAPAGAPKPAKKLEVDDFLITGAKVHFNGTTLPLPDIHFSDLGKGPEGITASDLIKRILGEITTATVKAVVSSAGDAGKALGGEAGKLGKSLGGLFKK